MIALAIIGGFVGGALTVVAWAICRAGSLADEWTKTASEPHERIPELQYVSPAVLARVTGLSESTIRHRCERGWYGASKPAGRWQIPVSELRKAQEEY